MRKRILYNGHMDEDEYALYLKSKEIQKARRQERVQRLIGDWKSIAENKYREQEENERMDEAEAPYRPL